MSEQGKVEEKNDKKAYYVLQLIPGILNWRRVIFIKWPSASLLHLQIQPTADKNCICTENLQTCFSCHYFLQKNTTIFVENTIQQYIQLFT